MEHFSFDEADYWYCSSAGIFGDFCGSAVHSACDILEVLRVAVEEVPFGGVCADRGGICVGAVVFV